MNTIRTSPVFPLVTGLLGFAAGIACLLFLNADAGDLEPDAPPGPTMKTIDEVEPRIPITSVPYTISSPGSYYFTGDLTSPVFGILVSADDVTIDLMGYTLAYDGAASAYGIYMDGRKNVEIRNGTVRDFGAAGIREDSDAGEEHRIIGVRAVSNGAEGIRLSGTGHLVKGCTVVGNQTDGIEVSDGCTVTGNTVKDNGYWGIYTASGSTVTGNTVYNNGSTGIKAGTGNTVTGNTAYKNGASATLVVYGIQAGIGSTVTGNTAYYNGSSASSTVYGIHASTGSTMTGNTASYNGSSSTGPYAGGINAASGCTVSGNTAYRNGFLATGTVYGIYLSGSNLVDQNTAYGNPGTNMNTPADCTFGVNEY